ncbi:hypothetical protein R6Q59_002852 [Mikania micrantha]
MIDIWRLFVFLKNACEAPLSIVSISTADRLPPSPPIVYSHHLHRRSSTATISIVNSHHRQQPPSSIATFSIVNLPPQATDRESTAACGYRHRLHERRPPPPLHLGFARKSLCRAPFHCVPSIEAVVDGGGSTVGGGGRLEMKTVVDGGGWSTVGLGLGKKTEERFGPSLLQKRFADVVRRLQMFYLFKNKQHLEQFGPRMGQSGQNGVKHTSQILIFSYTKASIDHRWCIRIESVSCDLDLIYGEEKEECISDQYLLSHLLRFLFILSDHTHTDLGFLTSVRFIVLVNRLVNDIDLVRSGVFPLKRASVNTQSKLARQSYVSYLVSERNLVLGSRGNMFDSINRSLVIKSSSHTCCLIYKDGGAEYDKEGGMHVGFYCF